MKKAHKVLLLSFLMIAVTRNSIAQSASAVPVMITVDANLTSDNKVNISWTVLVKTNTDYFDVEKSGNGINWTSVATIKPNDDAAPPSTYTVYDMFPLKGANFYRLRIKDLSGNTIITPIKAVRVNSFCSTTIYPNPAYNQINVLLGELARNDWYVSIISNSGQVMARKNFSKNASNVSIPIDNYPAGNYLLVITDGNSVQSKRIMINHK
ncbi:MAG: T9SS type A sorting domain-containing protein [Bacteroidota bacterium]